jgi:hypothetical protein
MLDLSFLYPEGISSFSPGLAAHSAVYPGSTVQKIPNAEKRCIIDAMVTRDLIIGIETQHLCGCWVLHMSLIEAAAA